MIFFLSCVGKDENYQKLSSSLLAMGGQEGRFGLELSGDLRSGDCNSDIDTFHTIQLSSDKNFDVGFFLLLFYYFHSEIIIDFMFAIIP